MEYKIAYLIHTRRVPAPLPAQIIPSHDLTFVHDGSFDYEINNERFTVSAGEALYCPRGELRCRFKSGEVYYSSLNFMDIGGCVPDLPRHIINADNAELRYFLKLILQYYESGGTYAPEKISALLSLMLCELAEINAASETNKYVDEIKAIIRRNPSKRHSVAELAGEVHLNPSYCSTMFKKAVGRSISDFALNCRFELAESLLERGKPIRASAEAAGFCDVYYFSRIFKKRKGMTPSEFRSAVTKTDKLTEQKVETLEKSKPTRTQIRGD